MTIAAQHCPLCASVCTILLHLDEASYANLEDRLMGLEPISCTVKCSECGNLRPGHITDLDVSYESGRIEFGELTYD